MATDVSILAISGVEDPVLPPHRAEAALRTLSNATHLVVPGAAHGPNFPGCVRDLAAKFLEAGSGDTLDTSCVVKIARPPFAIATPLRAPEQVQDQQAQEYDEAKLLRARRHGLMVP